MFLFPFAEKLFATTRVTISFVVSSKALSFHNKKILELRFRLSRYPENDVNEKILM